MNRSRDDARGGGRRSARQRPRQADEPPVDPKDRVGQASYDSFPASDPPAFGPTRVGPPSRQTR